MRVSINQPAYLPWLGYFERIAASDLHIVLDHVQFEKNSFVNRNKIRTREGWVWLTVPVKTKSKFGDLPIAEIEIDSSTRWQDKHWKTLQQQYARAPYFAAHAPFFQMIYQKSWTRLTDLLKVTTEYLLNALGITTPLRYSSTMKAQGKKDLLVLELCQQVGATEYLSGVLGRNYLDTARFETEGIQVHFQDYHHPSYTQITPGFEPYMSIIDLLFNHGPASLEILRAGQEDWQ